MFMIMSSSEVSESDDEPGEYVQDVDTAATEDEDVAALKKD